MILPSHTIYGREHLEAIPSAAFVATSNVAAHFDQYFMRISRHTLYVSSWWYQMEFKGARCSWSFHIGWRVPVTRPDGRATNSYYTQSGHSVDSPLRAANTCSTHLMSAWNLTNVRNFEEWYAGEDFLINA